MWIYNSYENGIKVYNSFIDLFEFVKSITCSKKARCYIAKNKQTNIEYFIKEFEDINLAKHELLIYTKMGIHSSIPKFYNCYVESDASYIVVEYIEGRKLRNTSSLNKIWELLETITDFLIHLHEKSILYCNLRPDNIIETVKGEFKIIDFGLSIYKHSSTLGQIPAYIMAPELVIHVDKVWTEILVEKYTKVDIWSLGVLLYMLTHEKCPYMPENKSKFYNDCLNGTLKLKKSNLAVDPLSKEKHTRKIKALNMIIDLCLVINPEERICISDLKEIFDSIEDTEKMQLFEMITNLKEIAEKNTTNDE